MKTKARTLFGRGKERPPYDSGYELLLGGSTRVVWGKNKWDEKKKWQQNSRSETR